MIPFFLFLFGIVFGSFLNVVSLRYDGEHLTFDSRVIGGRSHCPQCGNTLRWFELIPLVSFLIQGGRCRHCGVNISFQYPIVELIGGLLFMLVPVRVAQIFPAVGIVAIFFATLWILAFLVLLLIAIIDIRKGIIPDELQIMLGIVAVIIALLASFALPGQNISWLGTYAFIFGALRNPVASGMLGAVFGFLFFEALVLITRGRGIGLGDVKLALPLGFLFGWPDMLFLVIFGFIFGACFGIGAIFLKKKTMQGALPFAPFLSFAAFFVIFFGEPMLQAYFHLLGI